MYVELVVVVVSVMLWGRQVLCGLILRDQSVFSCHSKEYKLICDSPVHTLVLHQMIKFKENKIKSKLTNNF